MLGPGSTAYLLSVQIECSVSPASSFKLSTLSPVMLLSYDSFFKFSITFAKKVNELWKIPLKFDFAFAPIIVLAFAKVMSG